MEQDTTGQQPQSESRNLPEANFLQLAFLLGMQAMQCLGLIPNPVSNKPEVDLPLAKFNIDLLEMLQQKTKGNLTPEEEKGLEDMLFQLRMQFIELTNKKDKLTP